MSCPLAAPTHAEETIVSWTVHLDELHLAPADTHPLPRQEVAALHVWLQHLGNAQPLGCLVVLDEAAQRAFRCAERAAAHAPRTREGERAVSGGLQVPESKLNAALNHALEHMDEVLLGVALLLDTAFDVQPAGFFGVVSGKRQRVTRQSTAFNVVL